MDAHWTLGIQRLLDLPRADGEMTASSTEAGSHVPSVEDNLEL